MLNVWWVQFRSAGYNKSDEIECDIAAVYLMDVAGCDPEKAFDVTRILRSLDEEKPENTLLKSMYRASCAVIRGRKTASAVCATT